MQYDVFSGLITSANSLFLNKVLLWILDRGYSITTTL